MAKLKPEESQLRIAKAERALGHKRDVKLVNNKVFILNGKDPKNPRSYDLGNKAWGHVDALVNYGGYYKYYVDNFKNLHLAR